MSPIIPNILSLGGLFSLAVTFIQAIPVQRNQYSHIKTNYYGDIVFGLGNITYLANLQHPKATLKVDSSAPYEPGRALIPFTVIVSNETVITRSYLQRILTSYIEGDDVYSEDFLGGLYITSTTNGSTVLDSSAIEFISSINTTRLLIDTSFSKDNQNISESFSTLSIATPRTQALPAGPYAVSMSADSIAFAAVHRLYIDEYRDFLFGAYESNDGSGSFITLDDAAPPLSGPMIPVPSRIYYWGDSRPLAGERVAIKDLFDIKGLQTSGGSKAWATITPIANGTAPAIQQIIDLGGVLVGKYKLAQFASGANPWDWQDEHYPFNPRGDGYLTCSASSSGGGCAIAAYEWLDYAIGSDTGSSMRRPAAVSGTFGNRPSQGMIVLDRVIPLGDATDTAGVFSRDPYKWIKFAKAWYAPNLHQDPSITGLVPLIVPDVKTWPKRILLPVDYLPLANPAAQALLDQFVANLTRIFSMSSELFNLSSTILDSPDKSGSNITANSAALSIINSYHQWRIIAKPLITAYAALFSGRFPPVDPAWRTSWHNYNESAPKNSPAAHAAAYVTKRAAVEWWERNVQFATPDSCSESLFLYDIGTGGLPSYREQDLITNNTHAAFLAVTPERAAVGQAGICPTYGCADFTVPIGQVEYYSNVTFRVEKMPVTVNMVVKRGCDFMLFNMIEKLADEGVLKTVKTGRTAF